MAVAAGSCTPVVSLPRMAPVAAFTSVPNAGVSALFANNNTLWAGSNAPSSTRNCPPVLIPGGFPGVRVAVDGTLLFRVNAVLSRADPPVRRAFNS